MVTLYQADRYSVFPMLHRLIHKLSSFWWSNTVTARRPTKF